MAWTHTSLPDDRFPEIDGVKILETIEQGPENAIYRIEFSGNVYALKIRRHTSTIPLQRSRQLFHREAVALARIQHPAIAKVFQIGESKDAQPYLIMEFLEGVSLAEMLKNGAVSEEYLVAMAPILAEALGEIHRLGMIHRDLKPQNIIITFQNIPRIIDFNLVRFANDNQDDEFLGTLKYASPEQLHVIAHPVDGRSDLYSLGTIFYECLTGRLPFQAETLRGLLEQHLSVSIVSPEHLNPNISPALSAIVQKLLSKDPDDRYQTASALAKDLLELKNLDKNVRLDPRGCDKASPELVGRQVELRRLTELCARVKDDKKGAIVLLQGEAGIGKTAIVDEFAKNAQAAGWLVMQGKCHKDDLVPLGVVKRSLEEYMQRIATTFHPSERQITLHKIQAAAGILAPWLKSLTPRLGLLLDDNTASLTVPSMDQYFQIVGEFLLNMAEVHGGLIFIVDDVQWLDEASQSVFKKIDPRILEHKPILIVYTKRPTESRSDDLGSFIDGLGSLLVDRFLLEPLSAADAARLISLQLGALPPSLDIIEEVYSRTNGNPLGICEYIQVMLEGDALRPHWGRWLMDSEKLQSLTLPTEVTQLINRRLHRMSNDSRVALRHLSALGNRFDLQVFGNAFFGHRIDVHSAMLEALTAQVIKKGGYGNEYCFVNDGVRDILYSELSELERRAIHQEIAEYMDEHISSSGEEYMCALASHYSLGIIDKNPRRVLACNLAAGKISLSLFAMRRAIVFLNEALTVVPRIKEVDKNVAFELHDALGKTYSLVGPLALAFEHFREAEKVAQSGLDLAKIQLQYCLLSPQTSHSWEHIHAGLQVLGHPLPQNPLVQLGSTLAEWFWVYLPNTFKRIHGTSNGNFDHVRILLVQLLAASTPYSRASNRLYRIFLVVPRILHQLHHLGERPELVHALSSTAFSIVNLFGHSSLANRLFDRAMKTAEAAGDRFAAASVLAYLTFTANQLGEVRDAEIFADRIFRDFRNWLSPIWLAAISFDVAITNLQMRGMCENSIALLKVGHQVARSSKVDSYEAMILAGLAVNMAMLGDMRAATRYLDESKKILRDDDLTANICHFSSVIGVLLESEDFSDYLWDCEAKVRKLIRAPPFPGIHSWHKPFFLFVAYAKLRQFQRSPNQAALLLGAEQANKDLGLAGRRTPQIRGHSILINAVIQREKGRLRKAQKFLAKAMVMATQTDSPLLFFEIEKEKARIATMLGHRTEAVFHAGNASRIAQQYKWEHRKKSIFDEFRLQEEIATPSLGEESLSRSSAGTEADSNSNHGFLKGAESNRQLDALVQLNMACANVLDPKLLAKTALAEIIRLMGAERGLLFLCQGESDDLCFEVGLDSLLNPVNDPKDYSTTIINKVKLDRKPYIFSGIDENLSLNSLSIVTYGLKSIISVPLEFKNLFVGVVYLDSRIAKGIFTSENLSVLVALASQIPIAFETARVSRLQFEKQALEKEVALQKKEQELVGERLKAAHAAGMAEIATGAIHNIGNTLTMITAAFELLKQRVKTSKISTFIEGAEVLKKNRENLLDYITQTPRGTPLLNLFMALGDVLRQEQRDIIEKMQIIDRGIVSVKEVILMQQDYALVGLHNEYVQLSLLIEEAIQLQSAIIASNGIVIERNFDNIPAVFVQQNKLLNVLLTVITNSIDAMSDIHGGARRLCIEGHHDNALVRITIKDSGIGIASENLNRIFSPGFTTKKTGHGFGLHMCANAMVELGGSIQAQSDGLGNGATFTIHIPLPMERST